MSRKSKGAGSNEFSTTGKWMLHDMDTVYLTDVKNESSMYTAGGQNNQVQNLQASIKS